jgi:alpha-tubulin suppressor-like RCC1 family protein
VFMSVGDGRVYSWGRGTLGRLGLGSEEDQIFPAQVKFGSQDSVRIVGIAAGAYHSLALADDGSVWCWGYNLCILNNMLKVPRLNYKNDLLFQLSCI